LLASVLGIGVIGAGVMGAAHLRTLTTAVADARVVAVSDVDPARAAAAAVEGDEIRVHDDPRALLADPDVEAVLVASSDDTHERLVLGCLDAGKPVLCEKPLATTAEASLRVVAAEVAVGRRLVHVGFMRRYDPAYVAVKRALDAGEVGEALLLHCAHRNAGVPPAYTSEMLITSSGVHEIDVARWLLGEEIVGATVYAPRPTSHAPDGLRDPQFLVLETEGGVLVDIEVFANARYGYDIRCEVVGEGGTLALPDADGGDGVPPDFRARFAAAYREELASWVRAVRSGEPFAGPTAWDGHVANVVAEACLASLAAGGRAEVRLGERPALYVP
jgi:myo-inositol 2-dehydrogenase/D-chiro-inositol 1-dehydrogenase